MDINTLRWMRTWLEEDKRRLSRQVVPASAQDYYKGQLEVLERFDRVLEREIWNEQKTLRP